MNIFEKFFALAFAPKKCLPCFHCKELIDPDHNDYWQASKTSYVCRCREVRMGDAVLDPLPGFSQLFESNHSVTIHIRWDDLMIRFMHTDSQGWVMFVWVAYENDGRISWELIPGIPTKKIDHLSSAELYAWAKRVINFI